MKILKFVVDAWMYREGDIAGFDAATAEKLLKSEVAVAYEIAAPKAQPEEPKAEPKKK